MDQACWTKVGPSKQHFINRCHNNNPYKETPATRFFGTNKNQFLYSKLDDGTKDGRTKTGTRPKTCCRGSHSSPS